jgi:hypothetical protein
VVNAHSELIEIFGLGMPKSDDGERWRTSKLRFHTAEVAGSKPASPSLRSLQTESNPPVVIWLRRSIFRVFLASSRSNAAPSVIGPAASSEGGSKPGSSPLSSAAKCQGEPCGPPASLEHHVRPACRFSHRAPPLYRPFPSRGPRPCLWMETVPQGERWRLGRVASGSPALPSPSSGERRA